MKKFLFLLILIISNDFCFAAEAEKSVIFEIHKRKIPLAGYKMQIILDTGSQWTGDNLLEVTSDSDGRIIIPFSSDFSEKSGLRVTPFNDKSGPSIVYHFQGRWGDVVELNLLENINYNQVNQSLNWVPVEGASLYEVIGYSYITDDPQVISADFAQNMFDNRIHKGSNSYVLENLDTNNPLFEFKADFTDFRIPIKLNELQGIGIRISAYDAQGLLIAQSPYFPAEINTVLDQDQVQIEFTTWSKPVRDFNFEIVSPDEDGNYRILEQFNTGEEHYLILNNKDEWPEDIWVRFNVYGVSSDGSRKSKRLNLDDKWGKYIRFNLQSEIPVTLEDTSINWRETPLSTAYKVSFYRYKEAERRNVSPNYVQYDVVDNLSETFNSKIETTYSSKIVFDSPVLEIELDGETTCSWPEQLPILNHYGIVVRGYDDEGNEVAVSKLRVWPLRSPILEWNPELYDRDASALALSGIMMKIHNTNYDSLPIYPLSNSKFESIRDFSLGRDWGIYSREDLLESLDKLKTQGHSASLQSVLNAINNYSSLPLWKAAMKNKLYYSQIKRMTTVKRLYEYFDDRLLHAWDWGRAIYLIRWSYTMGYVSEDESWSLIHSFQNLIQKEYTSWDDFGQAYVLGRFYWSAGRGEEVENTGEAYEAFLELKSETDSPWNGLWIENDPGITARELDIEDLTDISEIEEGFNWFFKTRDALNKYPQQYESYYRKAPEGWDDYPQNIELFLLAAERNGDFEVARIYTEKALEKYPDYYPFIQLLSRLEENEDHKSEALAVFNKMDEWAVELPENQYLRGRLLYLQKKMDEALELFIEPMKDEFSDDWFYINAHYLSGIILLDQDKADDALFHMEKVYYLDSDNTYVQYYYGLCLLLTETEQALEIEEILRKAESAEKFAIPDWVWIRLSELKRKEANEMKL